jgi:hypothetical protein
MEDVKKTENVNEPKLNLNEALLIDEFEIIELENRLELAGRCNWRCGTPTD